MLIRYKSSRIKLLLIWLLTIFVTSCTSSVGPDRLVRKPTTTIFERLKESSSQRSNGKIIIREGDSLYRLARRHKVPLRALIEINKLKPPYLIYRGQQLKLPVLKHHLVHRGETIYEISRQYGVDMGSLVRINKISPPYHVTKGHRLQLPKKHNKGNPSIRIHQHSKFNQRNPYSVSSQKTLNNKQKLLRRNQKYTWSKPRPAPIQIVPSRGDRKFLWPLRGKVIVSFGPRKGGLHNDGINILARNGTSIQSTENGVVAYTGNQLQGFGNLILIKHSGGWMSAYAHSAIILVSRGDIVRRGQVIARVGRTGNVTRPQLHFELRRGGRAVNPVRYLVRYAHREMKRQQIAQTKIIE